MNLNDGVLRSRFMLVYLAELSFVANATNHAAGSSATINFTNLTNLATGVREARSVTVTVGGSSVNAQTLADMWVTALNAVLPAYGAAAFRGTAAYGNYFIWFPYSDEAPFPGAGLVHTGQFTSFGGVAINHPILVADLEAAQTRYEALETSNATLTQRKNVLELQLAATGDGATAGAGSTSVVVNNPATDTTQTVMAAIAGFGVGFMVRGARQEE